MDRYATSERLRQKGYFRKHQNRSQSRKAGKAGSCDCIFCSWEKQEKEQIDEEQKRERVRDKSENLHGVVLALSDVPREQAECEREARTTSENTGDSEASRIRDVLLEAEYVVSDSTDTYKMHINEKIIEVNNESEVRIREPVQSGREISRKVRGKKSSSGRRSRRNKEIRESQDGEDGNSR